MVILDHVVWYFFPFPILFAMYFRSICLLSIVFSWNSDAIAHRLVFFFCWVKLTFSQIMLFDDWKFETVVSGSLHEI